MSALDPTAEEIAEATRLAADHIRRFGIDAEGGARSPIPISARAIPTAPRKMRRRSISCSREAPELEADGEMHGDTALSEELRRRLMPISRLTGEANLLVFPSLDAANIALNLLKVMTDALHVGPILLGSRHAGAYPDAVGHLARRGEHDGARRGRSAGEGAAHAGLKRPRRSARHKCLAEKFSFGSDSRVKHRPRMPSKSACPSSALLRPAAKALVAGLFGAGLLAGGVASAATCFTLQAELTHLQSRTVAAEPLTASATNAPTRSRSRSSPAPRRGRATPAALGAARYSEGPPGDSCLILVPKLNEMQVNLGRLDRLRMTGDGSNAERIREVQGMMADRGCGGAGGETWRASGEDWEYGINHAYSAYGTFRTVCVRTCDGYYFPISYATTSEQFPADARTCTAMCPGADVRLYSYANPGGRPGRHDLARRGAIHRPADRLPLPLADRAELHLQRRRLRATDGCRRRSGRGGRPGRAPCPVRGRRPAKTRRRSPTGQEISCRASAPARMQGTTLTTDGGRTIRVVGPTVGATPEQQGTLAIPIPTEPPAEN